MPSTPANAAEIRRNRAGSRAREEILDAATRVMSRHGFEGASISAIMKESGLQKSSIYWQFGSKAAIAVAVIERGASRFYEDAPPAVGSGGRPVERLRRALGGIVRSLVEHQEFLRVYQVLLLTNQDPEVAETLGRIRAEGQERMRRLVEAAFAPDAGPDAAARVAERAAPFALAVFDGVFLAGQFGRRSVPPEMVEAMVTSIALYAESLLAD